jgi:sulfatase modifying factor 1
MSACCSPSNDSPSAHHDNTRITTDPGVDVELIELPGGDFWMGAPEDEGYAADGEGPVHQVQLTAFSIAPTTVSNADFAVFCDATGYVTLAEADQWSFVFGGLLPDDYPPTRAVAATPWWRQVEGSDWRHPAGPHTTFEDALDHPVVHVTWDDAMAYCQWSGTRLPTEAEWEYAARGGLEHKRFPWGDDLEPDGTHLMNVFQGTFPGENTTVDGFAGTAPVRSFPPNGFGIFEMTGNVWEWCADWFDPGTYREAERTSPRVDPDGPLGGAHRVMRGGSYLCHDSYCTRYRVGARSGNTPDSASGNIGFRVVR